MKAINTELEKFLEHYWEPEIKIYINNLKSSMKTYQYLIIKSTKNDILELIKLANQIKIELDKKTEKEKELTSENILLTEIIDIKNKDLEFLEQEIRILKGISNK